MIKFTMLCLRPTFRNSRWIMKLWRTAMENSKFTCTWTSSSQTGIMNMLSTSSMDYLSTSTTITGLPSQEHCIWLPVIVSMIFLMIFFIVMEFTAASKSPFVFFESPLFQARTLCGLAAEMKKTYNPKGYLTSLCFKMQEIWRKMMGWSRIELLW